MAGSKRSSRRERGGAMVEGALVLAVVLIALIGVMDCGYFLFLHQTIAERTRNAGRTAIVNGFTEEEVVNYVVFGQRTRPEGRSSGIYGIAPSNVTASFQDSGTNDKRLVITVHDVHFSMYSPLLAATGNSLPVRVAVPLETP